MHFGILGPLDIDNGTGAIEWRGAKRRGLLALFLVNRANVLTLDRIVEELWPEPSAGAPRTVQTYVSQLRRIIAGGGAATLEWRGAGYVFDVDTDALDAARFESLVVVAERTPDPNARVEMLRTALACWRGDALEEFLGASWADTAAAHLEALRVRAHELCVRAELDCGRGAELVAELETLTARYPLHERLWGARVVALYRAGRQADALAACRELRDHLVDELGIEPGHEISELERQVLEHDVRLLARAPRLSPAAMQQAIAATAPGAPARDAPDAEVVLHDARETIGRIAELGRLEAMLADARAGRPGIAVVRGDIGIGKTRLVCDLIDRSAPRAAVHVVACNAYVQQSFLNLAALLDDGTAGDGTLDALKARLHDDAEGPGIRDDDEWQTLRSRVFAALRARLAHTDGTGLTVLVVEDVHWADAATLEFLEELGAWLDTAAEPPPLAVVVTRRAFGGDEAVEAVTAALEDLPCTISLRLRPLHEIDVHELVRANGIDRPARALVRMLHERSRGNPLYVTEALRRMHRLGAFVDRSGAIDTTLTPSQLGAPADLQALIEERVGELDGELADTLGVAALHDEVIDLPLLARVVGDDRAARLPAIAGEGIVDATPWGLRFTHQLVVGALRDRLPPERRRAMHREIANALRERRDRDGADVTTALGHHIVEGGLDGVEPRAIQDLWSAGRVATQLAEWGQAARMFEAAIAVAVAHDLDPRSLAWMQYWAGRCLEHDYDVEPALARYREAAAWGRTHGDLELWGRAALAAGTRVAIGSSNVFDNALDVSDFTSVLPHLDAGGHAPLRCRIVRKYAEVQMQLSRFDEGVTLANDALAIARETGDRTLAAQCASTLAYGHLAGGAATAALDLLRGIEPLALEGRPESEGFALCRLGIAALMVGDIDEADHAVAQAGAVFDAYRHRTGASLAETLAANLALLHGDVDTAAARSHRAHELFRVSQYFLALPILFGVRAEIAMLRDDPGGAAEAVADWRATGQLGADLLELMVAARRGAPDVAERARAHAGLLAFISAPSVLAPSMAAIAAEVAYATRDATLAGKVLTNLDRLPDGNVVLGNGFPYVVDHTRGLLHEAAGDRAAAIAAYRSALDVAQRTSVPLEVARSRVALARLLVDDEPGDARRHADAARAIADRHGFVAVARDARHATDR